VKPDGQVSLTLHALRIRTARRVVHRPTVYVPLDVASPAMTFVNAVRLVMDTSAEVCTVLVSVTVLLFACGSSSMCFTWPCCLVTRCGRRPAGWYLTVDVTSLPPAAIVPTAQ
jgi:hypothetical protein